MRDPGLLDPYLLALKASEADVDYDFWRHATGEQRDRAFAVLMAFSEAVIAIRGWRDPPEDLPCVKDTFLVGRREEQEAEGRRRDA